MISKSLETFHIDVSYRNYVRLNINKLILIFLGLLKNIKKIMFHLAYAESSRF